MQQDEGLPPNTLLMARGFEEGTSGRNVQSGKDLLTGDSRARALILVFRRMSIHLCVRWVQPDYADMEASQGSTYLVVFAYGQLLTLEYLKLVCEEHFVGRVKKEVED